MAIPKDLQFVWVKGVFRDPDDEQETDLWEWALVYHVMIDADTGGEIDPDKLELIATHKMNGLISGGGFTGFASGMWVTKRGATNLLSETTVEIEQDVEGQPVKTFPCCAPQTSILVVGRTNSLKHQTRKWLPGINRNMMLDVVPMWALEGKPFSAALRTWCLQQLVEQNYFGVGLGRDVVWDPVNEQAREIRQIIAQLWPRTIRARTLSAAPLWIDV